MKKSFVRPFVIFILLLFGLICIAHGQGSIMRKLKEKAEEKVIEDIFDAGSKEQTPSNSSAPAPNNPSPQNQRGGGLTQEQPNVPRSISEAESALAANKYLDAKSFIKSALWGIELEIGHNVLKSLPVSVGGLKCDTSEDQISSTGIGYAGLLIERNYNGPDDTYLQITIGNESAILNMAGTFLSQGMYVQTTDQSNHKKLRFQEHNASIQYSDNEGYTLTAPIGQSSAVVIQGVNFASESQFMTAANNFQLNSIKKELGEQ